MNHPHQAMLHDFVDEELSRGERARIASHLAECPTCRSVVSAVRELREAAARVFGPPGGEEVLVPPHLWEGIKSRIFSPGRATGGTARPRAQGVRPWSGVAPIGILMKATAVLLVVGLSSFTTYLLVRSSAGPGGSPQLREVAAAAESAAVEEPPASTILAAYKPVITDLERLLEEGRGRLRPETIATLEDNLRIIDAAIRDVERAIASDPAHPGNLRSLDGILRTKLELLEDAVQLTAGA